MSISFKSLFLILFYKISLSAIFCKDSSGYLKKEYSLIKPYQDDRWSFTGSTMVTGAYVRLTPDQKSNQGAIWNVHPNTVRNWELHIHFKAHGHGTDLYGDGLAIWYTKHSLELGPVFGSRHPFNGLGIFLDTYANQNGPHNHGHPYISAMINNGSSKYDHDRDGTHTELDGCESQFRNSKHETYIAIRYHDDRLTVSTDIEGHNTWKQCFSVNNVRLPTGYFFGASAATGDLSDNHDILSMKLYEIEPTIKNDDIDYDKIEPSADHFASPRDHADDPSYSRLSGWKWFGIIVIGIIGISACLVVSYFVYTSNTDRSRKRLY